MNTDKSKNTKTKKLDNMQIIVCISIVRFRLLLWMTQIEALLRLAHPPSCSRFVYLASDMKVSRRIDMFLEIISV